MDFRYQKKKKVLRWHQKEQTDSLVLTLCTAYRHGNVGTGNLELEETGNLTTSIALVNERLYTTSPWVNILKVSQSQVLGRVTMLSENTGKQSTQ